MNGVMLILSVFKLQNNFRNSFQNHTTKGIIVRGEQKYFNFFTNILDVENYACLT